MHGLGGIKAVESSKLNEEACQWEEIVVYDNVEVVDAPVQTVYKDVCKCL